VNKESLNDFYAQDMFVLECVATKLTCNFIDIVCTLIKMSMRGSLNTRTFIRKRANKKLLFFDWSPSSISCKFSKYGSKPSLHRWRWFTFFNKQNSKCAVHIYDPLPLSSNTLRM